MPDFRHVPWTFFAPVVFTAAAGVGALVTYQLYHRFWCVVCRAHRSVKAKATPR